MPVAVLGAAAGAAARSVPVVAANGWRWSRWPRPGMVAPTEELLVGDVVYTSRVEVVRERGPMRTARVPGRTDPITFGVHGAIAEHYGVGPDDFPADATTIDYLVAAAGG